MNANPNDFDPIDAFIVQFKKYADRLILVFKLLENHQSTKNHVNS
jgi:hypothetical protein